MKHRANRIIPAAEAARLWALYGFASPEELILENLAMVHGLVVMDGKLGSAAARLVRTNDAGIIRVNQDIPGGGQRRFAIAHEIGHWLLHKQDFGLLACTETDMLASYKSSPLESEASIFASALLMPEHLFLARVNNRWPEKEVLDDLCDYFNTSLTPTAVRYVETCKDYCVFVLSENNKVRWWRASSSFGDHQLWIENKSILPKYSIAARFFRGESVPKQPQDVGLQDWLGEMPGIDGDTLIELAIPMPNYKRVLSLLWLP